jgi:DNA-binding PadR family transcriptional regulator
MKPTELAILCLLNEKPGYGYEIEQTIEGRGMREWTEIGFSSIYYVLGKLHENGLITATTEAHAGKGPERKVFRITDAGRRAAHAGVIQALSTPVKSYPAIQLGLANLPSIPRKEACAALRSYRDDLRRRIGDLDSKRQAQGARPVFAESMFDYTLTMLRAEMEWVDSFADRWEMEYDEAGF